MIIYDIETPIPTDGPFWYRGLMKLKTAIAEGYSPTLKDPFGMTSEDHMKTCRHVLGFRKTKTVGVIWNKI